MFMSFEAPAHSHLREQLSKVQQSMLIVMVVLCQLQGIDLIFLKDFDHRYLDLPAHGPAPAASSPPFALRA